MYKIDPVRGMCDDLISVFLVCGDLFERHHPEYDPPKTVKDIYKKIKKQMGALPKTFSILVNDQLTFCYLTNTENLVGGMFYSSLEDFADEMIRDISTEELFARIISAFDKNSFSLHEYRKLMSDDIRASAYIENMDLSDKNKLLLLSALIDKEGCRMELISIINKGIEIVYDIHEKYAQYKKSSFKVFEDTEQIMKMLEALSVPLCDKTVTVAPAFLNTGKIYHVGSSESILYVLGFECSKFAERISDTPEITLESIAKTFGDKTRRDIILKLSEKDCYLSELSASLDIIPSSAAYHAQILYNDGVIRCRTDGKKTYYKLNRSYFKAFKELADKLYDDLNKE